MPTFRASVTRFVVLFPGRIGRTRAQSARCADGQASTRRRVNRSRRREPSPVIARYITSRMPERDALCAR